MKPYTALINIDEQPNPGVKMIQLIAADGEAALAAAKKASPYFGVLALFEGHLQPIYAERQGFQIACITQFETAARKAGWSSEGCFPGYYDDGKGTQWSYASWQQLCELNGISVVDAG